MKATAFLCAALFVLAVGAQGDDFKTLDGKEYKNVTVSRVESDGIQVESDSGIEKVLFTNLPPDVQKKYGYDPQKIAAAIKQQEDVQRQAAVQAEAQDTKAKEENKSVPEVQTDPVATMKALVASFPKKSVFNDSHKAFDIYDVSYDVQKTDSLVNPVVGLLNFTVRDLTVGDEIPWHIQLVFHWINNHWVFAQIIDRKYGDMTNLPGGASILDGEPIKTFIGKYR